MDTASPRFGRAMIRMLGGLLIWAVHFGVIYGLNALACARGFAELRWLGVGVVAWGIAIATVAALAAVLALTIAAVLNTRRPGVREDPASHFLEWMTAAFGGCATVAIVWDALPVLLIPPCA